MTPFSAAKPFVSVIVSTLNDSVRLKLCLEALDRQTYPAARMEVIVVDNASTEDIRAVTRDFSGVVYMREDRPGLAIAHNSGVRRARGEVIAFTDSDCIPSSAWIENGVRALLAAPNTGLVGGRMVFLFDRPECPTAVELYDSITYLQQKAYVEKCRFAVTANLFTTRKVLDGVGFFNEKLKSGADTEWGKRVHRAGYGQVYAHDAAVCHPARRTMDEMLKKKRRVTGGMFDLKSHNGYPLWRAFFDAAAEAISPAWLGAKILMDRRVPVGRKSGVLAVMCRVRFEGALERVRLVCGGRSKGWT